MNMVDVSCIHDENIRMKLVEIFLSIGEGGMRENMEGQI
jgi:hypothetical protein